MNTNKIRLLLNTLFMIGAVASVCLYFFLEDKHPFIYVCAASLFIKMVEFFIRFMR